MKTMPVKNKTKSTAPAPVSSHAATALMPPEDLSPEELEGVEACLAEYLSNQTSKERARLMKRLEAPDFKATARAHMHFLGQVLPLCVLADHETFASTNLPLLRPKYSADKDLRAISLWFLTPENSAQVLQELEAFGGNRASGQRRANIVFASLEEISSHSSGKSSKA